MKQINIKFRDENEAEKTAALLKSFPGETLSDKLTSALQASKIAEGLKDENQALHERLQKLTAIVNKLAIENEQLKESAKVVEWDVQPDQEPVPDKTQVSPGSCDEKEGIQPDTDPENWLPDWVFSTKTGILAGIVGILLVLTFILVYPNNNAQSAVNKQDKQDIQYVNVDSIAASTLEKVQRLASSLE